MNTVEILRAARDKIAAPGGWTRLANARDARGTRVPSQSPRAVCFCAIGAIGSQVELFGEEFWKAAKKVEEVIQGIGYHRIPDWNDHPSRTQEEVVEIFDRAIFNAKGGKL